MDEGTAIIFIVVMIFGGVVGFLLLYRQNANRLIEIENQKLAHLSDPDVKRIRELEIEVATLLEKVQNLERLSDLVIERNGDLTSKLQRAEGEREFVISENQMLRRRLSELGLK